MRPQFTIGTRAQRLLALADRHVTSVQANESDDVCGAYSGLCRKFPVLVRTCGLCQTLAFCEAKAEARVVGQTAGHRQGGGAPGGEEQARARAHRLLLDHATEVLRTEGHMGCVGDGGRDQLSVLVERMSLAEYMMVTRLLLAAWVYYGRLAESILGAGEV